MYLEERLEGYFVGVHNIELLEIPAYNFSVSQPSAFSTLGILAN